MVRSAVSALTVALFAGAMALPSWAQVSGGAAAGAGSELTAPGTGETPPSGVGSRLKHTLKETAPNAGTVDPNEAAGTHAGVNATHQSGRHRHHRRHHGSQSETTSGGNSSSSTGAHVGVGVGGGEAK